MAKDCLAKLHKTKNYRINLKNGVNFQDELKEKCANNFVK
jgi:hypothetical protein